MPAEQSSVTSLNNMLKRTDLLDGMVKQFDDPKVTLSQFAEQTGKVTLAGQSMQFPIKIHGSGAYANKNENELLLQPGTFQPGTISVSITEAWTALQITERAIEASASDTYAWGRAQAETVADAINTFDRFSNAEVIYPASNAFARVSGSPTLAGITLYADGSAGALNSTTGAKLLRPGMRFSNSTGVTGTVPTGTSNIRLLTVTKGSTPYTTDTCTADGTLGDLSDGDYLILGSSDRTCMGRAMVGLLDAIDNANTYLGVDRTTAGNEYWQSKVYSSIGTQPLELKICTVIDDLWGDNGSDVDMILSNVGAQRRHFVQSVQDRRYIKGAEDGRYKSGYTYLAFQSPRNKDLAWVLDRDMPSGTVLLIDKATFKMGYTPNGRPDWFMPDKEGGPFHWVEGYACWNAYRRAYRNLFCTTPNKNAKMTGVTPA